MLARADHDFVIGQVRPSKKAQKRQRLQWLRTLFRKPGRVIVGAAATAVGAGILINALALQGGPHPAPLFHPAPAALRAAPATPPAVKPLSQARTQDAAQAAANAAAPQASAPAPAARASAAPVAAPVPTPTPRDPIADMIKGGSSSASVAASGEPVKSVLAAQRALNKLNYGPIKPDGLAGPGTRQAIERFERDRKLPVTGEASGRTARELAAASGIAID